MTMTKKLHKGICAITLALIMTAISLMPIFNDITPVAEAAPGGGAMPMYSWGNSDRLGRPSAPTTPGAVPFSLPGRVGNDSWIHAATAAGGSYGVNSDNELFAWGNPRNANQMGQGPGQTTENLAAPTQITVPDESWIRVSARSSAVSAISSNGQLFRWGAVGGSNNRPTLTPAPSGVTFVYHSQSNNHILAISSEGHLYSGTTSMTRIEGRDDWEMLSASASNFVGITESGQMWQITPAGVVSEIGLGHSWKSVATNNSALAAINTDGELFTAGSLTGALTRMGIASDWVSVSGGASHFLAYNEDYELWTWGSNTSGQLGLGHNNPASGLNHVDIEIFGFTVAQGGGTQSLMLFRTTPAEGEGFITKDLQMPAGTPIPDLNFTFTITAHSFNGDTTRAYVPPVIPNRVITIDDTSEVDTENGITTLTGLVDALAGITFTHSGVFSYTVQEQQNTSGALPPSTVTYSQAQYRLNIYVQRDFEQMGYVFEIVAITVYRHINDNGTAVTPPEKVEDGLLFTNQYRRTTSGTTEYPGGLRLTKTVVGEFADRTTPFDFDVTLTRTAMCPPTSNFQARIYNADGTLNSTVPITSGVSTHLTLRHRQSVVFQSTALPASTLTVGTGFTITERAAANFVASVELYVGDNPVTIPPNSLPNTALSTGARIIGDSRNSADFTNTHLFTPPVGLFAGDVAPIAIVALAVLLVCGSVAAINKRKRIEKLSAAGE